ncbi:hypothetical protein D0B54_15270 [Solimonas sp. K1W22B-7]|uniref:hypothetical protein n=1 Tax=Solimonas sp. K1W22B-7 TaxID=2303331 RepID=UPI000E3358C3|nr:hypothetical protein [Solimonas sp. K1W22B-7]AXQ29954.1 hypothetical protein D0B54_15270 [Solimonas sp. K1W22B-7]
MRSATRLLPMGAAALLALAACSGGVGEGRRPTKLQVTSLYGGDSVETYECAAVTLAAVATFSGEGGDSLDAVSERSSWSSNDTGVAIVSNGDIPIPGSSGLAYAQGTVIVVGPGTATITADYAGLRAQYGVSATAIGELRITPELTRMAPETLQTFELQTTTLDSSVPVDLTEVAAWKVVTAGAPVSSDGSSLQSLSGPVDSPFVLEASLPLCGRSARRELRLGPLRALQLDYEQPAGTYLPLGYSEHVGIHGLFEDASAPPQELASQVTAELLQGDESGFAQSLDEAGRLLRPLLAREPLQLRFILESADISADTRVIEARELDILSLRLSADEAELELRDSLQAQAWGLFEDGIERPVRHDISWSSRNTAVAAVATGIDGGKITAQSLEGDTVIDAAVNDLSGLSGEIAVHTYRKKPE